LVVIDGKILAKLTLALLLTAIASCGSKGDTEPHGDTADAYAIVVRWFVDNYASIDADADVKQVVFVEALGEGVGIGLETQVAFVAASDSFADVRFIDDRAQAMDGDNVRDDVILLAIGPAITDGTMAIIECDQVLSEGNVLSWTFNLVYSAELWTLTSAPSPRA